jgi:hypothetical protein
VSAAPYKTIVVPTLKVHVEIGAALVARRDELRGYLASCGDDKAYWVECLERVDAAMKAWEAAK